MLNNKGTTLIEILISSAVVSFLILTIYVVLTSIVQNLGESKQRTAAIAIANERMEIMRNLSYEELGVIDGIVSGPMLSEEIVTRNNFDYNVYIDVRYIDDDFDGTGVNDLVPSDYKAVEIRIEWRHFDSVKNVEFNSIFVPKGIETDVDGGFLVINTINSAGEIVPNATVSLDSIENNPSVNYVTTTDNFGNLSLPGVPSQTYRINLSKDGYEKVQTYPDYPESSFYPYDTDLFVEAGVLNSKDFHINQASNLLLKALNIKDDSKISEIEIQLQGGRLIGREPETYNFDDVSSTDSDGEIKYEALSGGSYQIIDFDSLGNDDYELVKASSGFSFDLEYGENKNIELYFADKNESGLALSINDESTGSPLKEATVGVINAENGFDQSDVSDDNGKAFLPSDSTVAMEDAEYIVEIRKTGYQDYSKTITVDGFTKLIVELIPSSE